MASMKMGEESRVWLGDITYIPIDEGWFYLAGHKDLFAGEVVEYATGPGMTRNLIIQSLFKAVSAKWYYAGKSAA